MTKISGRKFIDVWNKSNGHCWYCGKKLDNGIFTIDHVIPKNKNGGNEIDNLVPCCQSCNSQKCKKSVEEFRLHIINKLGWYFSENQMKYLNSLGVILPDIEYKFYFEKENLQ
jgi:5-methylcytosine-specific restriction endonuclease McrA